MTGLMKVFLDRVEKEVAIDTRVLAAGHKAMEMGEYVAGMLTALNALYEFARTTATATMDGGEPLVRHKKRSEGDGEARRITVTATLNAGQLNDPAHIAALNCLSMLAVLTGNNTTFPNPGPLSNIDLRYEGLDGFSKNLTTSGTLVLFGPEEVKQDQVTDSSGQIHFGVQGRRPERDAPDAAKPVTKHFSLLIKGRLEPMNGESLGRLGLDSLLCTAGAKTPLKRVLGCLDAATDVVKGWTLNFSTTTFQLRDWSHGWAIDEHGDFGDGTVDITGVSCDSELGPWTIVRTVRISGTVQEHVTGPFTLRQGEAIDATTNARSSSGVNIRIPTKVSFEPQGDGYDLQLSMLEGYVLHHNGITIEDMGPDKVVIATAPKYRGEIGRSRWGETIRIHVRPADVQCN